MRKTAEEILAGHSPIFAGYIGGTVVQATAAMQEYADQELTIQKQIGRYQTIKKPTVLKWYTFVIIALVTALGLETYLWQRTAQESSNVELQAKTDSIAHQEHEHDSGTLRHPQPNAPIKANIKTWEERIDPVERIAVLINGKKTGDTTVYFTSKEEALRYLYDQMIARDTTIYWLDLLVNDIEIELKKMKDAIRQEAAINALHAIGQSKGLDTIAFEAGFTAGWKDGYNQAIKEEIEKKRKILKISSDTRDVFPQDSNEWLAFNRHVSMVEYEISRLELNIKK